MALGPWLWDEAPAPGAVSIRLQWWGEQQSGESVFLASPAEPHRRSPGWRAPARSGPATAPGGTAQRGPGQGPGEYIGSSVRCLEYAVRTGEANFRRYVRDVGALQLLMFRAEGSAGAQNDHGVTGFTGLGQSPVTPGDSLQVSAASSTVESTDEEWSGHEVSGLRGSKVPGLRGFGVCPQARGVSGGNEAEAQGLIGRVPVDLLPLEKDGRLDGTTSPTH